MELVVLLLMVVAVAGGVAITCSAFTSGRVAAVLAVVWLLGVAVPVLLLHIRGFEPFGPVHRDFGAALVLLVSPAVFVTTISRFQRKKRQDTPSDVRAPAIPTWGTAVGVLVGILLITSCWLIASDGVVGEYTPVLVSTVISSVLGGALAGLLAVRIDGGPVALLLGATCGGAVAVAVGAYTEPTLSGFGALLVVGGLVGVRMQRRRREARRAPRMSHIEPRGFQTRIVAALGVGGAAGVMMLGLIDTTGGMLHTGQPWLLLTQLTVTVITVIGSGAVAAVGVALTRRQ